MMRTFGNFLVFLLGPIGFAGWMLSSPASLGIHPFAILAFVLSVPILIKQNRGMDDKKSGVINSMNTAWLAIALSLATCTVMTFLVFGSQIDLIDFVRAMIESLNLRYLIWLTLTSILLVVPISASIIAYKKMRFRGHRVTSDMQNRLDRLEDRSKRVNQLVSEQQKLKESQNPR